MHSKSLLSLLAIAALTLSLGCGGGGGGGGGATTPTTYSVSGQVAPVNVPNSWAPPASVRGATLPDLKLYAQLWGISNGQPVALSDAVSVGDDGKFTLTTTTPNSDVIIKIFNSMKFDYRYHLGVFVKSITLTDKVNASSTARAFLNWNQLWKVDLGDNDPQLVSIVQAIANALNDAPPENQTFEALIGNVVTNARTALNQYRTHFEAISASNTALGNIFQQARDIADKTARDNKIQETTNYFSSTLTSTKPISGYGLSGFLSATKSRYDRYTVNNYDFDIQEIRFTSPTTASATVSLYISVTPKSGDGLSGSFGPVTKVIGWRYEGNPAAWKVWQDFPYLREQFGF